MAVDAERSAALWCVLNAIALAAGAMLRGMGSPLSCTISLSLQFHGMQFADQVDQQAQAGRHQSAARIIDLVAGSGRRPVAQDDAHSPSGPSKSRR